jgi:hypothetical protein
VVVSNGDAPGKRRPLLKMAVFIAAIFGFAFIVWFNYAWALWNLPPWRDRLEAFALTTLGDDWERQSRTLIGSHATDCGRVGILANPSTATECALKAFRAGKPFRVRYDLQGIDSAVSAGLVFTPDHNLYALVFDGDPMGQGGTSWSRQRVEKERCPQPYRLYVNPNGRLNCFQKEAVPPHDVMSPNAEPY